MANSQGTSLPVMSSKSQPTSPDTSPKNWGSSPKRKTSDSKIHLELQTQKRNPLQGKARSNSDFCVDESTRCIALGVSGKAEALRPSRSSSDLNNAINMPLVEPKRKHSADELSGTTIFNLRKFKREKKRTKSTTQAPMDQPDCPLLLINGRRASTADNSRGSECNDPSQSSADPSADPNVGLVNQPTHDGGANHSSGFSFGRRKKKKSSTLRASDQNEGGAGRPANGGSVPCSEISDDCSEDLDDEDLDLVSDDLGVGHGGPRRRKDKGSSSKKGAKAIQKLFEEWRASQDGREVSNQVFNVDVDTLFTLLFTNSKFYADFHKARKTKDMAPSEWEQRSGTNDKFREVTMTLALTNPMGPKHSGVTDSQAMISDYAHHGEMYVVHVDTTNSGIPYSDSFYVTSNFCLTRVSKRQSKLVVMGDIKYKKSVWGFIKSVIEKNTWEGLEAFYNDLSSALHIASEELAAVEDIPIPMPSVSHPSTLRGVKKGGLDHAEPNGGLGPSGHYGSTHANLCSESNISSSMRKFPAQPGSDLGGIFFKLAVILLISLLGANCFLFYKMWFLETTLVVDRQLQESNSKRIDPMIHLDPAWFLAKDGETRSTQQWLEILRQQEMVHQLELEKWNEMLGAATQLLRRTESSLSNIQKSIQPLTLKKLRNVLLLHDSEGADDSPPVKAGKTRHDGIPLSENQEKIVKNEL
eukprot:maker-scaffold447_size167621-snap-gene-0.51 protein:Tk02127 transcript:maker-scaffold447_size167621-snap-gene-0.51-mRNA-1 annotation:"gram domain-containing protein 1b"